MYEPIYNFAGYIYNNITNEVNSKDNDVMYNLSEHKLIPLNPNNREFIKLNNNDYKYIYDRIYSKIVKGWGDINFNNLFMVDNVLPREDTINVNYEDLPIGSVNMIDYRSSTNENDFKNYYGGEYSIKDNNLREDIINTIRDICLDNDIMFIKDKVRKHFFNNIIHKQVAGNTNDRMCQYVNRNLRNELINNLKTNVRDGVSLIIKAFDDNNTEGILHSIMANKQSGIMDNCKITENNNVSEKDLIEQCDILLNSKDFSNVRDYGLNIKTELDSLIGGVFMESKDNPKFTNEEKLFLDGISIDDYNKLVNEDIINESFYKFGINKNNEFNPIIDNNIDDNIVRIVFYPKKTIGGFYTRYDILKRVQNLIKEDKSVYAGYVEEDTNKDGINFGLNYEGNKKLIEYVYENRNNKDTNIVDKIIELNKTYPGTEDIKFENKNDENKFVIDVSKMCSLPNTITKLTNKIKYSFNIPNALGELKKFMLVGKTNLKNTDIHKINNVVDRLHKVFQHIKKVNGGHIYIDNDTTFQRISLDGNVRDCFEEDQNIFKKRLVNAFKENNYKLDEHIIAGVLPQSCIDLFVIIGGMNESINVEDIDRRLSSKSDIDLAKLYSELTPIIHTLQRPTLSSEEEIVKRFKEMLNNNFEDSASNIMFSMAQNNLDSAGIQVREMLRSLKNISYMLNTRDIDKDYAINELKSNNNQVSLDEQARTTLMKIFVEAYSQAEKMYKYKLGYTALAAFSKMVGKKLNIKDTESMYFVGDMLYNKNKLYDIPALEKKLKVTYGNEYERFINKLRQTYNNAYIANIFSKDETKKDIFKDVKRYFTSCSADANELLSNISDSLQRKTKELIDIIELFNLKNELSNEAKIEYDKIVLDYKGINLDKTENIMIEIYVLALSALIQQKLLSVVEIVFTKPFSFKEKVKKYIMHKHPLGTIYNIVMFLHGLNKTNDEMVYVQPCTLQDTVGPSLSTHLMKGTIVPEGTRINAKNINMTEFKKIADKIKEKLPSVVLDISDDLNIPDTTIITQSCHIPGCLDGITIPNGTNIKNTRIIFSTADYDNTDINVERQKLTDMDIVLSGVYIEPTTYIPNGVIIPSTTKITWMVSIPYGTKITNAHAVRMGSKYQKYDTDDCFIDPDMYITSGDEISYKRVKISPTTRITARTIISPKSKIVTTDQNNRIDNDGYGLWIPKDTVIDGVTII